MLEKIFSRCVKTDSGCLEWTGGYNSGIGIQWRYPSIRAFGKVWIGSRLVWTLVNGEISSGMCICHKCDNPKCLNPDHLFIGTHSDNMKDKVLKLRDHNVVKQFCPKGHPYSGDNLYVNPQGSRKCRECHVESNLAYRAANREKCREAERKRYHARKEAE